MLDRPSVETERPHFAQRYRPRVDPAMETPSVGAPSLRGMLAILRRRKWTLLAAAILIPGFAWIALSQVTPRYTASGTVIYDASEFKLRELQSILRADPTTEAVMASQAEILHGLRVIGRVVDQLNLQRIPEFNPSLRPPTLLTRMFRWLAPTPKRAPLVGPSPGEPRSDVLMAVQDATTVVPVKASRVLEVSFTAEDRVLAAAAVNMIMDVYVKDQLAAKLRAVHRANDWLENRVTELRAEVQQAEDRIASYRAQRGLVQGMYATLDAEQVSHLGESLAKARADLADASGRLDVARGRAGAAAQAAIAPSVVQLRAQQDALTAQLQSLLTRLGPNHPSVVGLRDQLTELQRNVGAETARVVAAVDAEVRADRDRVATLEQSQVTAQLQLDHNAQSQIPLNAMQRDAEAARNQLQAVLDRIQQTAQQAALETPDAHEVSPALPPLDPSFPRTGPLLAASGAFGILFGLLLVYLQELTDQTLHSGEDVRASFGLRCFALIPELSDGRLSVEDYVVHKKLAPFAEQFRSLRAGLWLGADRPRIIAVTAARAAEGKTTVTLALGRSAALSGERVVVLDCDTHQPTFATRLRADRKLGIVDCLQGRATLEQVLCKDKLTNLAFIQAGTADDDATRLFMSGAMAKLLQQLRQDYDLVLLDAPPVQSMTDTRVVAQLADATLLCVRWRHTARAVVQNALDLLQEVHASVAGIALTRVDARVHVRSGSSDADVYHPRVGGVERS